MLFTVSNSQAIKALMHAEDVEEKDILHNGQGGR